MIVFHGSFVAIPKPDLLHSRLDVDFGKAFYVTPIEKQAVNWCGRFKRQGKEGIVSIYDFDESALNKLKTLDFPSYSEDWLGFILNCRKGKDDTDYDIVVGGVANDKVFSTVELYFHGLIDKKEALKRLRYEKPNLQMAFRSEESLSYLRFVRSEKV